MAPPPPASLPLGERLKALAQTLQYVPTIIPNLCIPFPETDQYDNRFGWFVGYVLLPVRHSFFSPYLEDYQVGWPIPYFEVSTKSLPIEMQKIADDLSTAT